MKKWLAETHGASFELFRHFLVRFFDSDLVTTPGQWTTLAIGAFSLVLPVFSLVAQSLAHKYAYLSRLPSPEPYRHAVRADELWLLTMGMAAIGLLTAVKWQSLFPGLRDYLALGALPVRASQVFLAKLLALFVLISAAIATINAMPSFGFPSASMSRWQWNPSFLVHVGAHAICSAMASYFVLFAVVACQGVFLNLLRPRAFARVTGYLQGVLMTVMLVGIVLSLSIDSQVEQAVLRPELARWLPPVWFLGLYQAMLGDREFQWLASRALTACGVVLAAAMVSYLLSYRRHRELLMEGAAGTRKERTLAAHVLHWWMPNPRRQAVFVFLGKTLARSSQHRMVLMGYIGVAFAMSVSGIIGARTMVRPGQYLVAAFSYAHMVALVFLTIGLRHLFAIPAELRANWIFRITEREGRAEWLRAVDYFVLFALGLAVLAAPFPAEARLLGPVAIRALFLFAAGGLLYYEVLFSTHDRLPFTCSYVPGKQPAWVTVLRFIGLITVLPLLNLLLAGVLASTAATGVVLGTMLVICVGVHRSREANWAALPLVYEDEPEPVVRSLNLGIR
jgi:hypothetical protein